jgi:hypothetical protein
MGPGAVAVIIALCLAVVIMNGTRVIARHLGAARQAQDALTAGDEYRALTEEYRRLSDLAITAQEHTDLRLTEISVQMEELRNQVSQLQHILREVE